MMIEKKVKDFMERHSFHLEGKCIAVGVSGGPDSLALLHYLWRLRESTGIKIVAAHFDHMFRGQESYLESMFVRDFCKERDILFEMEQKDVPSYIEKTGKNPQLASRELRYEFYGKVMVQHHLDFLALGHHGDDQIETILMRLTRGSTGKARAGIPFLRSFENGYIVRPFLCLTKQEIERYCHSHQLDPRRDPSNEKDIYSRNRFRKNVLPFMKNENAHVHEHFQRFSEELQSDEEYLAELTEANLNKIIKKEQGEIALDIRSFLEMPMPLQRRGIKLILNYLYEEQTSSLSAVHIDSIFSIVRNPHPSGTIDLPNGLKIVRSYEKCHFVKNPGKWQPYLFELNGPGKISLPQGGMIEAKYVWEESIAPQVQDTFILDLNQVSLPLLIRTRKPGDRMTLKGMSGTRKIKDIFIDEKIPISERDKWPVVTDRSGTILWLPGLKKSSHSIGGPETGNLLELAYKQ
ncbi:tRNA lysidine(34) synthetase TilS [Mesobacillus foraminis]|uniref:tRNA lysidine(34) synthetase TilS n=1 Tax=Mesobacillus foraminis TaxID=279826 RepID=UPI00399F20F9